MPGPRKPQRAIATKWRLTPAGTVLLPVAAMGWILGLSVVVQALLPAATITALFLFAPLIAWWHLRGIELEVPDSHQVFVGSSFPLEIVARKRSLWMAARHIVFWQGGARIRRPRILGHAHELRCRTTTTVPIAWRLGARGRHKSVRITLASAFPLAVVQCRRQYELSTDLLGLPRPGRMRDSNWLPRASVGIFTEPRRTLASEEELYGVREWREGESLHRAHWKLSAQRGRILLREYRSAGKAPIHLVISEWVHSKSAEPDAPVARNASFERAVTTCATLAEHLLRDGHRLRLSIWGPEVLTVTSLRGRRGLISLLAALAETRARAGQPMRAVAEAAARAGSPSQELTLAVISGAGAELGATPPEVTVFNVDDPETDHIFPRTIGLLSPRAVGALR